MSACHSTPIRARHGQHLGSSPGRSAPAGLGLGVPGSRLWARRWSQAAGPMGSQRTSSVRRPGIPRAEAGSSRGLRSGAAQPCRSERLQSPCLGPCKRLTAPLGQHLGFAQQAVVREDPRIPVPKHSWALDHVRHQMAQSRCIAFLNSACDASSVISCPACASTGRPGRKQVTKLENARKLCHTSASALRGKRLG